MTLPNPRDDDPLVIRVLREHRNQLDDLEISLMDNMGRRWLQIERGLEADIQALALEFERRQAQGETITKQMIYRAERYNIIQKQLQDEIKKYNKEYAVDAISKAQQQYATLGIQAAQDAITAQYPSPLSASFNKINFNAVNDMIGFAGDGSPLYKLLKEDYPDAVDGLTQALINGLGRGLGSGQIAKDMANGMGMGLDRALLIARTESARAYRTASVEQYRKSGVVEGFMRLVKKATACAACLMLDGEVFQLAEELEDHPRGKCMVIPIVEGISPPNWQKGKDWFMEQSEADQKRILGVQKWQLWQDGGFELEDVAQHAHSDIWGSSPRVATLAELTDGKTIKKVPPLTPQKQEFSAQQLRQKVLESKEELNSKLLTIQSETDRVQAEKDILLKEITDINDELFKLGFEDSPENLLKREALDKRNDELWKMTHPLNERMAELYRQEKEVLTTAAQKARSLLYVDNPIETKLLGTTKSIEEMRKGIDEVFRLVDEGIITNGTNEVTIKFIRGRAHYLDTSNQISIKKNAVKTFAHEYGHFLEDEGGLREIAQAYLDSRTVGETAQQLRKITGINGYKRDEIAKADKFANPYTGKIYPSGHTEIISMGLEWIYYDPVGFAETDPDYFEFMVRILRGVK